MRKILKIARLELSVLFYSPIAWIILVVLFLQAGLAYFDMLYSQETQQQLERPLTVLTRVMFAGEKGMLSSIIEYLYLYIPLLTMGVFSREYTSGSIKLLQSSPVTTTQIVLGKYLSIVVYALIAVLMMSPFVLSAYFSIDQMDLTFVLCGLLGIFLLICTYSAVGLFMSSLTSYQIVAAISTLAFLAFLNYAPLLGAKYDGLREITNWLSISGRAEEIVNGLLTSREIAYFILVIVFFLSITILRMVQLREGSSVLKRIGQYAALIAVLFLFGFISANPKYIGYYDTTRINDRTISPNGISLAKRFTEPIKLVSYVNVLDQNAAYGDPVNRIADMSSFDFYFREIPQLKMEYIAYYDSIPYLRLDSNETFLSKAEKAADALNLNFKKLLTPEDIKKMPFIAKESKMFVRFFEYNGKREALRMYDDMFRYPREGEISAALLRLLEGPAKLGILSSNGERNAIDFSEKAYSFALNGKSTRSSMINQGFEILPVKIDSLAQFQGVGIIIADPAKPYSKEELSAIFQYIDAGGNVFLLTDPASSAFLQPIVNKLGLKFMDGTLMQESEDFDPDLLRIKFAPDAAKNGFDFYDGAISVMKGTVGIQFDQNNNGFERTVLIETDPKDTWNKTEKYDLALEKVLFNPISDKRVKVPTAVRLKRKTNAKDQLIYVFADADYMSNSEVTRFNINSMNFNVISRIFKSFTNGKFPVSGKKEKATDVIIKADRKSINIQRLLLLIVAPISIAIIAAVILRRRKRK
ncbi:hypothetical protein GCM10022216_01250 [Sphingobacterium kyonggiense]|uniref:ABC-type uncharacterized transport system domain-containing protein n=1 Tax=Sphingobacterium kyonggiense TaxID=714075 RepID=A0ABP7Y6J8_9SPHI